MTELEASVEELLSSFNDWFQSNGNESIVKSEKSMLKTFLWYLVFVRKASINEPLAKPEAPTDG